MLATAQNIAVPDWLIPGVILIVAGFLMAWLAKRFMEGFKGWVASEFTAISQQASVAAETGKQVLHEITPNGGTTNSNGDITKRTEQKIDDHAALDLKVQKAQRKETRQLRKQVELVHAQLRTLNGLSVGQLADRAEGHRVNRDVPREDRTVSDQHYSDALIDGERP